MAKAKEKEDDFYAQLAKATGGMLLKGSGKSDFFIDTGNLALNFINSGKFIGGGVPKGITEAYGPPQTAKTLLAMTILGNCQKMGGYAILLDTERSSNEKFAVEAAHVDSGKLIVYEPNYIEAIELKVVNTIRQIREYDKKMKRKVLPPIMFVWDSISVAMTEREWKENDLPENYSEAAYKRIVGSKERPGERAKAAGDFLRKINPFLAENGANLFVINQTRCNIGVSYGDPEVTAGGGKALPFYANCRFRMGASKQIEDKKLECAIGVNLTAKNKKSRSFRPFMKTTNIQLYFDKGIDPISGLLSVMINAGRVEAAEGKGVFKVMPPFSGDQPFEFEASRDKNNIPLEVLYKFPSLVDAESEQFLKDYLGPFADAIQKSTSDSTKEAAMEDDDVDDDDEVAKKMETLSEEDIRSEK